MEYYLEQQPDTKIKMNNLIYYTFFFILNAVKPKLYLQELNNGCRDFSFKF